MRCATVTTIYGFMDSGTSRGTYTGLTVGGELDPGQACPVGQYAVINAAEWAQVSSYSSFTDLSPAEAGSVALAIMGVWAVAWAFRMVIKAVNSVSDPVSQSDV